MPVDGRTKIGLERRAETRAKIIAAAFDMFGEQNGPFVRIEDVVGKAGITRATFYNHFTGIVDLHEALVREVSHDFIVAVTDAINRAPDVREGACLAVRLYLHRARSDPRWAWSMLSISASGFLFGRETHHRAENTVSDGISRNYFVVSSAAVGRDILLGSMFAAVGSILTANVAEDYPEMIAGDILCALGVRREDAKAIARRPLPELYSVA